MNARYVRIVRVYSRPLALNGETLEADETGRLRSVHEVVNTHLTELQEEAWHVIVSVQAQDTLITPDLLLTSYTIVFEEHEELDDDDDDGTREIIAGATDWHGTPYLDAVTYLRKRTS